MGADHSQQKEDSHQHHHNEEYNDFGPVYKDLVLWRTVLHSALYRVAVADILAVHRTDLAQCCRDHTQDSRTVGHWIQDQDCSSYYQEVEGSY